MAVFNEILAGRFNRFLQKITSIKGPPPAGPLAGEIMPVLPVEQFGVDNRFVASWNRFGVFSSSSALGLGNRSATRIHNPVGSNIIAVVEKSSPTLTTTPVPVQVAILTLLWTGGNLDFPTTDTAQNLDGRIGGLSTFGPAQTSPVCHITRPAVAAGAVVGGTIWEASLGAGGYTGPLLLDVILTDNQELTILPGWALTMFGAALNTEISVSWIWRERFLEDSERA